MRIFGELCGSIVIEMLGLLRMPLWWIMLTLCLLAQEEKETDRQAGRQAGRRTDRQAGRQTADRRTDGRTDGRAETDRQTEPETEKDKEMGVDNGTWNQHGCRSRVRTTTRNLQMEILVPFLFSSYLLLPFKHFHNSGITELF